MKRIVLILIFYLTTLTIFSQVVNVAYYDTVYMKNSEVKFGRELKDSLPDGHYIIYFPCEKKIKNNNFNCKQIKQVITYKNSVKTGLFIDYQIEEGIHFLSNLGNYKNGLEDKEFISCNKFGEIVLKGSYKDGKRNGEWFMLRKFGRYILEYDMDIIKQWKQIDFNGNIITQGRGTPEFLLNLTNP